MATCSPGLGNLPSIGDLDQSYSLGTSLTVTFPLIDNNECDLSLALYESTDGTAVTTPGITFTDTVTSTDPITGFYTVDTAAYMHISLSDAAYDGATINLVARVTSADPAEPPVTFSFALVVTSLPPTCVSNLVIPTIASISYTLGEAMQVIEINDESNGTCEYTLDVIEGIAPSVSPPAGITVVQPTFAMYPVTVATRGNIEVYSTDSSMVGIKTYQLRIFDPVSGASVSSSFDIQWLGGCVPGWLGATNYAHDASYTVASTALEVPLTGLSNTDCFFEVAIYDTSQGVTLPGMFTLTQPTFSSGGNDVLVVDQEPIVTVQTNNLTAIGTYTIFVDLSGLNGETGSFVFTVTVNFDGCTSGLTLPTLDPVFIYTVGQPIYWISFQGSLNGNCPFEQYVTRKDTGTNIHDAVTFYEFKPTWSLPIGANYYQLSNPGYLRIYSQDSAVVELITLTLTLSDLTTGSTVSTDFQVNILASTCDCTIGGVPAFSSLNYEIASGVLDFSIDTINANQCIFSFDVWDTKIKNTLPADVFYTQSAKFYNTASASDTCSIDNYQVPRVWMDTADWTLEYTVFNLLIEVASDALPDIDTTSSQLLSTITLVPPPCTPNLIAASLQAVYDVRINGGPVTISMSGASNGDCQFTSLVFEQSSTKDVMSTNDPIYASYTEATFVSNHPSGPSTILSLSSDAALVIEATDLTREEVIDLQLILTDSSGAQSDLPTLFQVNLFANKCTAGFVNVPPYSTFTYVIGYGPQDFIMTGLTNNDCPYSVGLYTNAGMNSAVDPLGHTQAVQPVFSVLSGQSETDLKQVDSYAAVRVETADLLLDGNVSTVHVLITSDRTSIDTLTASFALTTYFVRYSCTPGLTDQTTMGSLLATSSYQYKIGTAALAIVFAGADNTSCQFTSGVFYQGTSTPLAQTGLTFEPQTYNVITTPDIVSVATNAQLKVETSDPNLVGTHSFTYQIEDPWSVAVSTFDFTVELYNSLCTKGFRGVPTDGALDLDYTLYGGVINVPFTGLDNTECFYASEIYADAGLTTPADPAIFTLTQPFLMAGSGATADIYTSFAADIVGINSSDETLEGTSYTVHVKLLSQKSVIDTDVATFSFTVNFITVPCTPNLHFGTWATQLDYRIGDPQATFNFPGMGNGDCYYETRMYLELNDSTLGSAFSSTMISAGLLDYVEETLSQDFPPYVYSVSIDATLVVYFTDPAIESNLRIRHELEDPATGQILTQTTWLNLYNSLCTKGFRGVPTDGALDLDYTLYGGVINVPFTGLDNTECFYASEIYGDAGLTTPADPAIFTLTQADLVADAATPEIYSSNAPDSVQINASEAALEGTSQTVYVKLISQKSSYDTDTASFSFTVNFIAVQCTPGLQIWSAWPTGYQHRVGDPSLTINFGGATNNDCFFTSQVLLQPSAADVNTDLSAVIAENGFVYTAETLDQVQAPYIYSVTTAASLLVQFADPSVEATYDLTYKAEDPATGLTVESTFQLRVYNNFCVGGFAGLPVAGDLDTEYAVDSRNLALEIPLEGLTNGECSYSVSLFDAATGSALSGFITVAQPTFQTTATGADALDPDLSEVLQVVTAPVITVQTTDQSYVGQTIEVVVALTSTRYPTDSASDYFTFLLSMVKGCNPLFPTEPLDPLFVTFWLHQDTTILVEIPSSNLNFQASCDSPLQSAFSVALNDGSALTLVTLSEDITVYGHSVDLQFEATERAQLGTYDIVLLETSLYGASSFERSLQLTVLDHCDQAELSLSQDSSAVSYQSGDPRLYIYKDFIVSFYSLDAAHVDGCEPISFLYNLSGDFDQAWIREDAEKFTIEATGLEVDASFVIEATGYILDFGLYDSKVHQVQLKMLKEIVEVTEELDEEDEKEEEEVLFQTQELLAQDQSEAQLSAVSTWTANLLANTNMNAPPPSLAIEKITQAGLVTVLFSQTMVVPNFDLLVEGVYENTQELLASFDIAQFLSLRVESDQYSSNSPELAIADFSLVEFTDLHLSLQVAFAQPNYVSANAASLDDLILTVRQNQLFISEDIRLVPLGTSISGELPSQLSAAQKQALIEFEEALSSGMQAVSWANLGVNLALAYSLKHLWNAINLLQMAVFFPLWSLNYSENAKAFLEYAKMIVLMEFLPSHLITDPISDWLGLEDGGCVEGEDCSEVAEATRRRRLQEAEADSDSDPDSESKGEEVFEAPPKKPNLVQDLGIMLALAVMFIVVLLLGLSLRCCIYSSYSCFSCYMNLKQKIFYNAFIRFAIQSNLKMQIGACTTLTLVSWSKKDELSQGLVAAGTILIFLILPVVFGCVLYRHREDLETQSTRRKIGTLYQGIDPQSSFSLSYTIIFLLRRSLFCFFTFGMVAIPGIQVQVYIFSSMIYVIYLNSVGFDTRLQRAQENANEALFVGICYHLVLFANLVDDYETKQAIGDSLMYSCIAMLALNMLIILAVNCGTLKQKCRRRSLKRKQKKALAKAKQQRIEKELALQEKQCVEALVRLPQSNLYSGLVPPIKNFPSPAKPINGSQQLVSYSVTSESEACSSLQDLSLSQHELPHEASSQLYTTEGGTTQTIAMDHFQVPLHTKKTVSHPLRPAHMLDSNRSLSPNLPIKSKSLMPGKATWTPVPYLSKELEPLEEQKMKELPVSFGSYDRERGTSINDQMPKIRVKSQFVPKAVASPELKPYQFSDAFTSPTIGINKPQSPLSIMQENQNEMLKSAQNQLDRLRKKHLQESTQPVNKSAPQPVNQAFNPSARIFQNKPALLSRR